MNNSYLLKEDLLQSKIIDFLRFPLIIGVLFIHNNASIVNIPGETLGSQSDMLGYYTISTLFSNIIARVSVPLFFFISGFLFFFQNNDFTRIQYINKLKSRIKTLMIPYLFWNLSLLILLYIIVSIPSANVFLNKKPDLSFSYIIRAFWDINGGYPISYQFWFIRNLMVTVIITPIIYVYVKKLDLLGVFILGSLWYFNLWFNITGLSIDSLFFFSAGAWLSISGKSIISLVKGINGISIFLYPVIIIIDLLTKKLHENEIIHKSGIIIGMFFWINIIYILLKNQKTSTNNILTQFSFFLFAFHEPLLTIIKKILYKTIKPDNELIITTLYFAIVLLVVVISLTIYLFLRRLLPNFCRLITGGR